MNISYQALNVFVFLFPGFLAMLVYDSIVARKEKKDLSKIIEALIFSVIIYSVVTEITGKVPVVLGELKEGSTTKYFVDFEFSVILPLVIVSLIFPLLFGWVLNCDSIHKILRKMGITKQSSRYAVWDDVFLTYKKYIAVKFKDGRRLFDWPKYFSLCEQEKALYLQDAYWINDKNEYKKISGNGVLINPNEISTIEVSNYPNDSNKGEKNDSKKPKSSSRSVKSTGDSN